jgi:hypothetical protein
MSTGKYITGTKVVIYSAGGKCTVSAASGVTILSNGSMTHATDYGSKIELQHCIDDVWVANIS